jgi:hypothetical protein
MSSEKKLTEQESLQLITEMIQKAKASHFHENGTSAILWGSVIGFCGLFSFIRMHYNINIGGFDVWLLALIALIPQVYLAIQDGRKNVVKTDMQIAINAIWTVYGMSIFALIFYFNVVPNTSLQLLANENQQLLIKDLTTNIIEPWQPYIFSQSSLLVLLYGIPTLATGIARKFTPMLIGGLLCYVFFIVSCFTATPYDMLLNGLAGIFSWLIPGLILRNRFNKAKNGNV